MDNRRRYRRDKCWGMPVEKMCYIFAVINVVIVSLCVISCIVTMGFFVARLMIGITDNNLSQYLPTWRTLQTTVYPVYAIVCFVVAIFGIFAVLLLQGMRMNRPKLMKAYLLFGLIVEMLMIMATATYIAVVVNLRSPSSAILNAGIALAIVTCVAYSFVLNLVRRAYLILSSKSKPDNSGNEQAMLYICEH